VDFECDAEIPEIPARTQAELLRISQEALSNVRRHAGASTVTVRALLVDHSLVLRITDDGCGFDMADVGWASVGLASMRERAAIVGGDIEITSAKGDGTRVAVSVPLRGGTAGGAPAMTGVPA
jgi:signal transduction histidine kinase